MIFQQNQAISSNAKFSVAELGNQFGIVFVKTEFSVVEYDKIVTCSLVFKKFDLHKDY